jgi:hypothetical protein
VEPSKLKYLPELQERLMVGWGFAFGRGFVVLLWSIVWAIVAGIVGVLIIGGSLSSLVSNPTAVTSNPTGFITGFLAASFLGIFLIIFISVIGLYATIVKVAVDGALSQLEKSGQYSRGSSSMGSQSIGSQPTMVAPAATRKFCANCGTALPGGMAKCPNCGASL